jgi:hypothetical protein
MAVNCVLSVSFGTGEVGGRRMRRRERWLWIRELWGGGGLLGFGIGWKVLGAWRRVFGGGVL